MAAVQKDELTQDNAGTHMQNPPKAGASPSDDDKNAVGGCLFVPNEHTTIRRRWKGTSFGFPALEDPLEGDNKTAVGGCLVVGSTSDNKNAGKRKERTASHQGSLKELEQILEDGVCVCVCLSVCPHFHYVFVVLCCLFFLVLSWCCVVLSCLVFSCCVVLCCIVLTLLVLSCLMLFCVVLWCVVLCVLF
jgi:hypothetical protein